MSLAPTAEFYASPTDNSTAVCILELGTLQGSHHAFLTGAWLDLRLWLVLADSGLVGLPT